MDKKPISTWVHKNCRFAAELEGSELVDPALQAAESLAAFIRENDYGRADVWNKETIVERGWGSATADAAVSVEGFNVAEMQIEGEGWFETGMNGPTSGVFAEAYSPWLMYFYQLPTG